MISLQDLKKTFSIRPFETHLEVQR